MTNSNAPHSRRAVLAGMACALAAPSLGGRALAKAPDLRRINLVVPRTGERLEAIYAIRGNYVPDVMQRVNRLLRDVRADEARAMDPRLLDIMSDAQRLLGHDRPFSVISGYRSRRTNDALRRRSRGVAKNSYHTRGMAADLRMKGVDAATLEAAGRELGRGGVGLYTASGFVHLDSGPVRRWGR